MEVNPYKVLEIPQNFTLEQLRSQYKKIALSVHPDKVPGNSDYMFKMVTKCYKMLLKELEKRESDKPFYELKASYDKHVSNTGSKQYRHKELGEDDRGFDIDRFNNVFETNKMQDVTDTGYDEWIKSQKLREPPKLSGNINANRFNEEFDKYSSSIKDKNNKYIIKYKEPEPLVLAKKLNFIELGTDRIDDFSGENRSNRSLNYMDYKVAHSTSRLYDPDTIRARKDYRSLEDYERDRANVKRLSAKELAEIEKRKRLEEVKEKKRQELQAEKDMQAYEHFLKVNKLFLGGATPPHGGRERR